MPEEADIDAADVPGRRAAGRIRPPTAMQRWVWIQVSPPVKLMATSTPVLPLAVQTARENSGASTIVDDVVGAEFLQLAALLLGGGAGETLAARHLRELQAGDADATAGAEDQNLLAGLDLASREQHAVRGAIGDRQRRRLVEADIVRDFDKLALINGGELAQPAIAVLAEHAARREAREQHDALADPTRIHILADSRTMPAMSPPGMRGIFVGMSGMPCTTNTSM